MAIADLYGWFPMPDQIQQPSVTGANGQFPVGAYAQQAQGLLGDAKRTQPFGSNGSFNPLPAVGVDGSTKGENGSLMGGNGLLGGSSGDNQRFSGFGQGAAAGASYGPWGALVGGLVGYGAAGGVKDANPIDASGFSGISMDQAWKDQNLARLGSNPGAAIASKLGSAVGIDPDSTHGKALMAGLDPVASIGGLFRSKHGDEKRNINAFLKENPGITDAGNGMVALPDGMKITRDQLQHLAGTWYGAVYAPDGDQQGWQQRYNDALTEIYSQPMYNDFGD